MSQESRCSVCTLPSETGDDYDDDFLLELHVVDELYFAAQKPTSSDGTQGDVTHDSNESSDNYESDADESVVSVDHSDSDNVEYIIQNRFRNGSCGCKEFYDGKACSSIIDFDSAVEFREYCHELSREELDIVIKVELFSHRRTGSHTEAKKHKSKERERPYQEFYFNGKRICRATFCFTHGIGRKKLQAIAKSLDNDGLAARVHGATGKPNKRSLAFTDRERIKHFLYKYALDNALPLPGRFPNFKKSNVLLLPSDKTTADIHEAYENVAKDFEYRSISLRTFQRTWHDLCPNIVLAKPCTDLCHKCQDFAEKISRSGNLSEEQKAQLLDEYNKHVSLAKEQRDFYRQQCQKSRQNFIELPDELKQQGKPPNSLEKEMHYSWDYAQQVHYPHHAQQVGPIYFLTPRKCGVFGICSEASGKQTFYLIDEAESPGKGANSVVSMAHHYFQWYGYGETDATIHFDNCQGHNKNNVVLLYALWRVITGLHCSMQYSMMIAGHTKFDPDWHFGVWKVKWRNSTVENLNDIADTVNKSSKNGHNIAQLIQDGDKPVKFFDWKSYLQQFFKPLKNITKYHHFLMKSSSPGQVQCREYCSSNTVSFNLLRNQQNIPKITDLPDILSVKELDAARQWYLYEQIRKFCYSDSKKDSVCPKPIVPKKEVDLTIDHEEVKRKPVVARKKALLN